MEVKFDDVGPETITWDYFQKVCHNALDCVAVIAYRSNPRRRKPNNKGKRLISNRNMISDFNSTVNVLT